MVSVVAKTNTSSSDLHDRIAPVTVVEVLQIVHAETNIHVRLIPHPRVEAVADNHVQFPRVVEIEADHRAKLESSRWNDVPQEGECDSADIIERGVHADDDVAGIARVSNIPRNYIFDHAKTSKTTMVSEDYSIK